MSAMTIEAPVVPVARVVASQPLALGDAASVGEGSFAAEVANVDAGRAWRMTSLASAPVPPRSEPGSALGMLARQLDEIGRHRVEARALSEQLAGAWASGVDAPTLAVSMHRHARAMASHNLGIMWGAKLVGVTAGALRQLLAAA